MKSYMEEIERICPRYHTRYCYEECQWFGNCPDQERGDQLPEDEAVCCNCGRIQKRDDVVPVSPGRSVKLFCRKCYGRGMSETRSREFDRINEVQHSKYR